ncbi:hypothetical protein PMZ80_007283 [Knufia obscura]|uniref:Uncharacterized protein n=2 Tax=Knufia TaxID=430999 RepID=A0AAN8EPN2_9EURO|nr:hypothetical protein PMZ80_007283 [Knufia obscura]KAK5953295.1 hypothetical protein OHC33_005863 [Knufia fluminis]
MYKSKLRRNARQQTHKPKAEPELEVEAELEYVLSPIEEVQWLNEEPEVYESELDDASHPLPKSYERPYSSDSASGSLRSISSSLSSPELQSRVSQPWLDEIGNTIFWLKRQLKTYDLSLFNPHINKSMLCDESCDQNTYHAVWTYIDNLPKISARSIDGLDDFTEWTTKAVDSMVKLAELLEREDITLDFGNFLNFLQSYNKSYTPSVEDRAVLELNDSSHRPISKERIEGRRCNLTLLKARLIELGRVEPWR